MKPKFQFGFDIGSISINTVVMDSKGEFSWTAMIIAMGNLLKN